MPSVLAARPSIETLIGKGRLLGSARAHSAKKGVGRVGCWSCESRFYSTPPQPFLSRVPPLQYHLRAKPQNYISQNLV